MINRIRVGPFQVVFGNVNAAMGLRGHYHTARVTLVYGYFDSDHGYPVFQATNAALRDELQRLTKGIFRDATNEDVVRRLFDSMRGFQDESWLEYGGGYWLEGLELEILAVQDDIGHDPGSATYTTYLGRTD